MSLADQLAAMFVVALAGLVIAALLYGRSEVPQSDRWPPIDDDEFVRRCTPGVSRDTALRVRRIVAEQLGVEYSRVYPEQRFVEDLHCD